MQPEINSSEQERVKKAELEAEYAKLKAENVKFKAETAELEAENAELLKLLIEEYAENEADIAKLKTGLQYPILIERVEVAIHKLETRNAKIKPIIEEYTKKLESKKNRIPDKMYPDS